EAERSRGRVAFALVRRPRNFPRPFSFATERSLRMYKVNGMMAFPIGRKRRELDFRAPEDRLPLEDDEAPMMRSSAVNRLIDAFFAADQHADNDARTTALQGLIDANR